MITNYNTNLAVGYYQVILQGQLDLEGICGNGPHDYCVVFFLFFFIKMGLMRGLSRNFTTLQMDREGRRSSLSLCEDTKLIAV